MKVTLFTKKDKPNVDKVIAYLKNEYADVTIFAGKVGDPFPACLKDYDSDLLISYISPWIIPKEILNKTKIWNINFHPGPPAYPGIGCFNFAIYNGEKEYGVTAHLMEKKVDRGKILGIRMFPIEDSTSVYDLSIKSYEQMLLLYFEIMDFVSSHRAIPECNEKWLRKPYKRSELEELCRINPDMPLGEIKRRIRATVYPNMPGAYIELYGHKFEYNLQR
jgi:methionyl-tRNA formyltransferase